MEHAVVVGRGLNYSNAFEFALKLMETCYVVAERFSSADFLHGPIAMVEQSFPVFLFAPAGVTWPGMRDMLERLNGLKAETLVITDVRQPGGGGSNPRAMVIPAAKLNGRVVHADSVHHSGADFRGVSGGVEGPGSGQAAHAEQSYAYTMTEELFSNED